MRKAYLFYSYFLFLVTFCGFIPSLSMGQSTTSVGRLILPDSLIVNDTLQPITQPFKLTADERWPANSVLREGKWFVVAVKEDGVFKITPALVKEWGLDPSQLDPNAIGIYSLGASSLPETNGDLVASDLNPIPSEVVADANGSFDEGEMVRFFGQGPNLYEYVTSTKRYTFKGNIYSDVTRYFVRVDDPAAKRIERNPIYSGAISHFVTSFVDFQIKAKDSVNLGHTGRLWYGEEFNKSTPSYSYRFSFPDIVLSQKIDVYTSVVALGKTSTTFTLDFPQVGTGTITVTPPAQRFEHVKGVAVNKGFQFTPVSSEINCSLTYNFEDPTGKGNLDYIMVQAVRSLKYLKGGYDFWYIPNRDLMNFPEIQIANLNTNVHIWNVTLYNEITDQAYLYEDATKSIIRLNVSTPQRFFAFEDGDEKSPLNYGHVPNQNLHALDPLVHYIIIAPDSMMEQAERLGKLHAEVDGFLYHVVDIRQVLNEFSNGSNDPAGIRNFMRMLYNRAMGGGPRFLLLFGDGSFDPQNRIANNDKHNLIPTWQSVESLYLGTSHVTDDFYGILADGEGDSSKGSLKIGIGRLSVDNLKEAEEVVNKIIHYVTSPASVGKWRNKITFVADDEDYSTHFKGSRDIIQIMDTLQPGWEAHKIFLDAYVQETNSSGSTYPAARADLLSTIDEGTLMVNYTGHGGELGWTSEGVLVYSDVMKWKQLDKLPLFITATCEFSRFDDPGLTSAGELVLLNPDGGGIALLTTTRLAYSSSNSLLHTALFKEIFAENSSRLDFFLGDIIRKGKNKTGNILNLRNFTLLGDPAMRIAFPEFIVKLQTINGTSAPAFEDTLTAMEPVHLTGSIINSSNVKLKSFNGKIIYRFFDKPVNSTLLGNDKESTIYPFKVTDRLLEEGEAEVVNGDFDFYFLPPSTMNLALGKPLINFYAYDSLEDARGSFKNFWFSGISEDALNDKQAPSLQAWINSKNFVNGDIVAASGSMFLAELSDYFGINASGTSIGRDIIAIIDENYSDPIVLNGFFQGWLNNYKGGNIAWMMPDFSVGTHTITLRAWDYNGNSSEVTLTFNVVGESEILRINSVSVVPNPFSSDVSVVVNHNLPGQNITATIEVYDLNGRVVYRERKEFSHSDSALTPFVWNGKNGFGGALPDGYYPTRVILESEKWVQRAGFNLLKISKE